MPKESRQQKSSKLLPVITRQKKPKSASLTGNSQSLDSGTADISANQKVSESVANQRLRKSDGVKHDRKETSESVNKFGSEKVNSVLIIFAFPELKNFMTVI